MNICIAIAIPDMVYDAPARAPSDPAADDTTPTTDDSNVMKMKMKIIMMTTLGCKLFS